MHQFRVSAALAFILAFSGVPAHAQSYTKPQVRAITAFVRLDPATLDRQIADALTVLRAAEAEGANVVQEVFARTHGDFNGSVAELTKQLTIHARVAESVGGQVAATTGWTFMGVDPTPAPLGDVSIGTAIETYTGAKFGSSGTLTAALIITTAVKAVPVKQIGYSGLMVPVLEDRRLAQRWAKGTVTTDNLLAYSAVCGTGLDTIPYPGDISVEQIARIFGDVASLAWKWNKPLSARLQPVAGKKAGDLTEFSGRFLFNTRLHELP